MERHLDTNATNVNQNTLTNGGTRETPGSRRRRRRGGDVSQGDRERVAAHHGVDLGALRSKDEGIDRLLILQVRNLKHSKISKIRESDEKRWQKIEP